MSYFIQFLVVCVCFYFHDLAYCFCITTACFSSSFKFFRYFLAFIFSITCKSQPFFKSSPVASAVWGMTCSTAAWRLYSSPRQCSRLSLRLIISVKKIKLQNRLLHTEMGTPNWRISIQSESVRQLITVNKLQAWNETLSTIFSNRLHLLIYWTLKLTQQLLLEIKIHPGKKKREGRCF